MILETERLILRDFVAEDWQAVLTYQRNPLYLRYYAWTTRTPKEVQEFVTMFLEQQTQKPRIKYQLAIILRSSGALIGNCGVRMNAPNAVKAEIGYEIDPAHWGRGYATEAATTITQYGFTELKVHRIWASCNAENVGSARVLKKLGMKQEGHLRDNEFFKGHWWDTLIFGILEDEWQ